MKSFIKKHEGVLVVFVLIVIGLAVNAIFSNMTPNNQTKPNNTNNASQKSENTVLKGPARKEIEEEYNRQSKMSQVKADAYADSLKDQEIIWIGNVEEVSDAFLDSGYTIAIDINGYSVDVKDPEKKYGELNKGEKVKISGKIDRFSDILIGATVYIKDASIEVVQ